jgi:hypothetical protein
MGTHISQFFTYEEATQSEIADRKEYDNTPERHVLINICLAAHQLDVVRAFLGGPIIPSSWFRCLQVNRDLKSPDISQHVRGEAIDFRCPSFGTPIEIVKRIATSSIQFDQLILEHSWVHISFVTNPTRTPRREVLTLLADRSYAAGITDKTGKPL